MRRVLCLWLPNWPLQRRVEQRSELRCQRVLVIERQGQRGQRIVACSPLAFRQGVQVGMPLAEALALLPSSSDAPVFQVPHAPAEDLHRLQQLARWCEQFSPLVGVEEVQPKTSGVPPFPETLLLDITHLERLFSGEQGLVQRIKQAFEKRGFWVRYAIADTPGAAWAIAHCLPHALTDVRMNANSQSDEQYEQVTGQVVAHGGQEERLQHLPVEALRLPENVVHLLHQLGVYQIAQLRTLPRDSLLARFGQVVLQRLDQAYGRQMEIWNMLHEGPVWRSEKALEPPTQQRDQVQWAFEKALQQLTRQLHQHQQGVVQFQCSLRGAAEYSSWKVGLFRPTSDFQHLWELGKHQLEQARVEYLVSRIVIEATQVAPLEHRQAELFQNQRTLSRQWPHLINRLSNRMGDSAVVQAKLQSDSQPEHAFQVVPLTSTFQKQKPTRTRRRKRKAAKPEDPPTPPVKSCRPFTRPLQFFEPEIPLEQVTASPDCPLPLSFVVDKCLHQVHRYWGPERIETGWWRGASVRRDYYRVATIDGLVLWIFRHLGHDRWFLHGQFF